MIIDIANLSFASPKYSKRCNYSTQNSQYVSFGRLRNIIKTKLRHFLKRVQVRNFESRMSFEHSRQYAHRLPPFFIQYSIDHRIVYPPYALDLAVAIGHYP